MNKLMARAEIPGVPVDRVKAGVIRAILPGL